MKRMTMRGLIAVLGLLSEPVAEAAFPFPRLECAFVLYLLTAGFACLGVPIAIAGGRLVTLLADSGHLVPALAIGLLSVVLLGYGGMRWLRFIRKVQQASA